MAITDDIRIKDLTTSTQIHDGDWLVKDNASDGTKKISPSTLKAWINDGMATVEELETVVGNIADTYNTSESYVVDDLCIHEYALYKCIGATTGPWDSTKWQATTIAEIIATIDLSAEAISYDNTSSGLEAENVQDAIGETITKLSAVGSASGAIATFDDGSDLPMPSLKVAIEPQQDLHGYDAPWVGGAWKNKFDIDATHEEVSGSTTYSYTVTVKPNTAYTMSSNVPQGSPASLYFNGTATNVNGVWNGTPRTFTSDSNGQFIVYVRYDTSQGGIDLYTAVKNGTYYIQLEEGSTATSYAPYSNICPISGWNEVNVTRTGKNLWGGEKLADDIVAKVPQATKDTTNKTITYSASNIANKVVFNNFKPNTVYTIIASTPSTFSNLYIYYTDGTNGYVNPNGVTVTDSNKSISDIRGFWVSGTTVLNYEECGVFEGVITAQDFEPYNGQTYTIDLDGTRYGGTLDVVSGVLTVDRVYVDLGSLTWTYQSTQNVFSTEISGLKRDILICSNYKYTDVNNVERMNDGEIWDKDNAFSPTNVIVKDLRYTSASDFQTAMNGVQLVYNLATPITIQLTPTQVNSLLGVNNIWADTGNVLDAEYIRDTTTIINSLIARIEALENQ